MRKLWKIFETPAISKIIYLALVTAFPQEIKNLSESVDAQKLHKLHFVIEKRGLSKIFHQRLSIRRAIRGGGGAGLPCPFLKIEKSALILEKKALHVSILGLNLPFKM